ncbi:MAG: hypothetical protein ACI92I_000331 [Acidimicrobiales bacterium]|jgi:hypothetical protein
MVARKKLMVVSLVVVGFVLLGITAERITLPGTTDTMKTQAAEYITVSDKPLPPNAFTYDGCTLFPDVLPGLSLYEPCLQHDIAYWAGGDISGRKLADVALRDAISHTSPVGFVLAPVMYTGVRLFGNSFITKLFNAHWGYGWDT